jgi:hypothetical protein
MISRLFTIAEVTLEGALKRGFRLIAYSLGHPAGGKRG